MLPCVDASAGQASPQSALPSTSLPALHTLPCTPPRTPCTPHLHTAPPTLLHCCCRPKRWGWGWRWPAAAAQRRLPTTWAAVGWHPYSPTHTWCAEIARAGRMPSCLPARQACPPCSTAPHAHRGATPLKCRQGTRLCCLANAAWPPPLQVVSAKHVARGKPAPDVYLEALRRLGCADASRALVVEHGCGWGHGWVVVVWREWGCGGILFYDIGTSWHK